MKIKTKTTETNITQVQIAKAGPRKGDGAEVAILQLV